MTPILRTMARPCCMNNARRQHFQWLRQFRQFRRVLHKGALTTPICRSHFVARPHPVFCFWVFYRGLSVSFTYRCSVCREIPSILQISATDVLLSAYSFLASLIFSGGSANGRPPSFPLILAASSPAFGVRVSNRKFCTLTPTISPHNALPLRM